MAPLGPTPGGRMVSINWASVNRTDPQADSAARKGRFFLLPNGDAAIPASATSPSETTALADFVDLLKAEILRKTEGAEIARGPFGQVRSQFGMP
jgi:hypothetical protein